MKEFFKSERAGLTPPYPIQPHCKRAKLQLTKKKSTRQPKIGIFGQANQKEGIEKKYPVKKFNKKFRADLLFSILGGRTEVNIVFKKGNIR